MSDLQQIDDELARLCREYDEAIKDLSKCAEADARASHALELAKAKAYVLADGTIPEKQAQVTQVTDKEALAAKLADAYREAARARVKSIDKQLSVLQTRAGLEKSERDFSRFPTPVERGRYQIT